jgi:MraZ protein
MLRGSHQATVDEKGRMKIPADFLAELRKSGNRYYVTSENGVYAKVFPLKAWEEIEKKLAKVSSLNVAKQKFLARTSYFGQQVDVDGQGRILMPPVLREEADLKGEVNVQGRLTYLEIWNNARFLNEMKQNPITPEDAKALEQLGI